MSQLMEHLKGISGLLVFLNHPAREPKLVGHEELIPVFGRLLKEALEEDRIRNPIYISNYQNYTLEEIIETLKLGKELPKKEDIPKLIFLLESLVAYKKFATASEEARRFLPKEMP